jgi:hypothetical protein
MARILTYELDLPKAEKKMLHALGADHKKTYIRHGKEYYRPYRNYFDAGKSVDKDLETMVEHGRVERQDVTCGIYKGFWYFVTKTGREYLEKVTGCHIYGEEE